MTNPVQQQSGDIDWDALIQDPRFQRLHKSALLWGLMVLTVGYYFLLPVGAAYFPELFRIKVWGVVNIGLLFALSEFALAWIVALVYARRAGREFDVLAAEIAADFGARARR
jgi:uncharacterized membrane protein (DUF485 family)